MESLSHPLHSRKLSNATTFSTKNAYDGIFSGNRRKYAGASPIDLQDYREIFGSSQATCSIPVLDLSTLGEPSDVLSLNLRSSKPDYSTIFGGFRNEDVAVPYQELFARDKTMEPSSTPPTSQDSDYLSHQSSDALKQFNMSYNKISQKSKDGLDATKHVTQLHAVPGYTHFIDDPVTQPKMEAANVIMDSSKEGKSVSEDKFLKTSDIEPKIRPSTVSSPSASPTKPVNHKDYPMRPTAVASNSCKTNTLPTYFDEERDVNSDASASAAALRKAIEKAQESIRIAKESVGRKKKGLRSFSNKKFKDSVKIEGNLDDVTSATSSQVFPDSMDVQKIFVAKKVIDEINGKFSESTKGYSIPVQSCNKFEDNTSSTEVTGETESRPHDSTGKDENATFSSDAVEAERTYNMFVDDYEGKIEDIKIINGVLEHQNVEEKLESVERVDIKESNNIFVPKMVEDEKEVSTTEHSMPVPSFNIFKDNTFVSNSTSVTSEKESRLHDSAGKDKHVASSSDEVDTETTKIETSDFVHEDQTYDMFVDDYDGKIEVLKTTTGVLEDQSLEEELESVERVEVDISRELKENKDEAGLGNAHESVGESTNLSVSQKVENEKEVSQEANLNDDENECSALENEKQEEVLEQEDIENAENVKSDYGIEEAFEFKDDPNTEIHKEEETSETFVDDCELETKEGVKKCDSSIEESEVNPCDDCEMKQEDKHTLDKKGNSFDESCDQEFDENSSGDDNVVEETDNVDGIHVASNIVDMNDNNVETNRKEEKFFEKTCVDQTASDDDENEYEVISEENDIQSVSSSGTTHGVKILEEKSSPHKEILPHIVSTNEFKDSREQHCSDKEDEIEKPGPSKVSGKDHFTRIDDEEVAREREREKNKLAVERAIREARERAFAEARERAERERAAVEKATQEVRQRMMADAREKVAKSSLGNQSSSEKTSSQSKLRAERAAVERATSEARQRALEKAMSQKIVSELNKSESALRTKAKLEKQNRIMERAAKALAEKEKRDLLAQKEQAERNRLAENLDADIKRWSKGKEGNLRALLSTLQYILGPESGWQPVSLTEIISTSAVKKAYRKATLCVHPDKLQQRGATIQQKYTCEKVFDLLKAAWNRFNSEER